jgi:hypothetical protein
MFSILLLAALAQENPFLPPDQRAFNRAMRIADREERARELKRILVEYPGSGGRDRIKLAMIDATARDEAEADRMYRAEFPNPIVSSRYKGPRKRTALLEAFAGADCGPCVAVDLAIAAALERYSRDELAVVVYHRNVPTPDPLAAPLSDTRADFYKTEAVPFYAIDGEVFLDGGGRSRAPAVFDALCERIEKALVAFEPVIDGPAMVVAVDPLVRHTGRNGIRFHHMVAGRGTARVAFAQDPATKRVARAYYADGR